jgi:tetratricopeptide (TPR) repeat protein
MPDDFDAIGVQRADRSARNRGGYARMNRFIGMLVLVSIVLVSCATSSEHGQKLGSLQLTDHSVLYESPLRARDGTVALRDANLLEVSPEMESFIDEYIGATNNHDEQLRRLTVALVNSGEFALVYDDSTRTASETFEARRGNCFSFTSLLVALARELGLEAHYQEVQIPPNWSMTGQAYVFSQHVNAYVDLLNGRTRVVDFNSYDYIVEHESAVISDRRAAAHFYNNIGAEHMLADESAMAYAYFRESLLQDASFSPAWVNIGILHRRENLPRYAEASYLKALEADRDNLMAMSNLANLYQEMNQPDLAQEYLSRVRSHRMRNPYYRFHLAREAFAGGDYDSAIRDLKYAIGRRREESEFYSLLSLSYLMKGDRVAAKKWMERAKEVAARESDRNRYQQKLDVLAGAVRD